MRNLYTVLMRWCTKITKEVLIDKYTDSQLTLDTSAKVIQSEEVAFSTNDAEINLYSFSWWGGTLLSNT